jgi:hypothetical protein
MKKCLVVGNGIIESIDNKIFKNQYDEAYFFCNNLDLLDSLNFLESKLLIQNFTLNFSEFEDNLKYVRYFKALSIKTLKKKIKTILIGKHFNNKYIDYDNLLIEKTINHQIILKNLINFIGFKALFFELKFFDFIKILFVSYGLKSTLNASLRPSSGYFLIIYLINHGAQVDTLGITNPNKKYFTKNVNSKERAHVLIDGLIYTILSLNKKIKDD